MKPALIPTLALAAFTMLAGHAIARTPAAAEEYGPTVEGVRVEKTLPKTISFVAGKLCFDSDGGLPEADEDGRRLKLWECDGSPGQAFTLRDGVLFVGYDRAVQIVPDIKPEWVGCLERTLSSKLRDYRLAACTYDDKALGLEANFYDPQKAILHSVTPRGADTLTAGRPLLVAPINAANPAAAMWEYVPGTKIIRASGTNLCVTPPLYDMTDGAPLSLDDCDAPMMDVSGAAGPTDGRASVRFMERSASGKQYWLP